MKLKKTLEENYKALLTLLILTIVIVLSILIKVNTTTELIGPEINDNSIITVEHINSGAILTLETASTAQKREQGLMFRNSLEDNHGMIFIFPKEMELSFWMKNTSISLDMIFLDEDLKVTSISDSTKINQTEEIYTSKQPSQFAIETLSGWTLSNSVQIGDQFKITSVK